METTDGKIRKMKYCDCVELAIQIKNGGDNYCKTCGGLIASLLEVRVMPKNYGLMLSGVDEEIRELVDILNRNGYETVASCSGHGKMMGNIALRDGRELMIIENFDKARKVEKILIAEGLYKPLSK